MITLLFACLTDMLSLVFNVDDVVITSLTHYHHHHHCLWPLLEHRPPTRFLQASRSWASLSSCPLCFSLQIEAPGVSWAASLSLSLWVPGQGLTCNTGHWLSEGAFSPSPASLEDVIFCWLLLGPFPEFSVADGLRPSDPKDSSTASVWIFFSVADVVLYVSAP